MLSRILIEIYRQWYGRLNLKGFGFLLSKAAHLLPQLKRFPLEVPGVGTIDVDFRDASAFAWQNYLLGKKCQEHGLLLAMAKYCKPNGVLWDIGANIGLISAYFAAPAFELHAIHAFEPNPDIYARLQQLFKNLPVVHGHNMALSSETASKQLYVPYGGSCLGSLEKDVSGGTTRSFTVACHAGDDLLERLDIPAPTLVKIDVEGHEMEVLAGLRTLTEKHRPVIFLENIFLKESSLHQLVGYRVRTISDEDGEFFDGFRPDLGHNIALIPDRF